MNNSLLIILQGLVCLVALIVSVIMLATVISAGKGKIVAINTIKGIGLAGIVMSVLMILLSFTGANNLILAGILMLAASILYTMSVKNFKLAKIGVILVVCAMVVMPVMLFLFFA